MAGVIMKHFVKTLTVANVAYPLVTNLEIAAGHSPDAIQFLIYTATGNAGNVYLGDENVDTTLIPLDADDAFWWGALPQINESWHHWDLTKIYVMGSAAGDTVTIQYQTFED